VVLRRKNIAARPSDASAKLDQSFDQNGRLNGHVERAGDPDARQRLLLRVFLANGHQAGHLVLGDGDFFAAPIGQTDIGYFVCRGYGLSDDSTHADFLQGPA
jgi:hypothetical protein